eukprot:CAMPEP_0169074442 /NCGR_PEP_ID=MMETSP1015-20121227/7278_1 /TAXON_ID=342587 /ORGANISM="Karlodinium micrum, Strain CCMP2283" /LENGTH=71 /DNA_ID=CAMNT_0009133761 /DNA_START=75 /DNA_END=290 /DNA_ORIENTATION=+
MGLQRELQERECKDNLVIRDEEGEEASILTQAADSLSSAFESFEASLSQGMESILGSASSADVPEVIKKVD